MNSYERKLRRAIFVALCGYMIFIQFIFIAYAPVNRKIDHPQNDQPNSIIFEPTDYTGSTIETTVQDPTEQTEISTEVIPTEDPYEETSNNKNSNQENNSTQPPTEPFEDVKYFDVPLEEDLQNYSFKLCDENSIDPALVIAMIYREASYNPATIGDNGKSFGLMQIQPKWHQWRMDKLNCPNLLDPYQNVTVGIDFLSDLFGRGKSVEWVLMAYNGGPSYADKKEAAGEVSGYAKRVLEYAEGLERK